MFDIKNFHLSILEELLNKRLGFDNECIDKSSKDREIINHIRKSLPSDEEETQLKKQRGLFDVTMRALDGAEVCKLVSTYMLFLTSEKYNE